MTRSPVPNWSNALEARPPAARRRARGAPSPRRRRVLPRVEALEDRTVPSTFTVTNTNDSGDGSLRQAVLDANALAGPDAINFALAPTDHTIALTSGELSITDSLSLA